MLHDFVFVVSLHRTGTQSTNEFLNSLGYRAIHNPSGRSKLDFQHEWLGHEGDYDFIFRNIISHITGRFNAISDNPMSSLYEPAYKMFNQAKFILATRDPEGWVRSVRQHIGERDFVPAEKVQYWKYLKGKPLSLKNVSDRDLIDMFNDHTVNVVNFFEENDALDQLCVADLDKSNGALGHQICDFLATDQHREFLDIDKFR